MGSFEFLALVLVLIGFPAWGVIDAATRADSTWDAVDQSKIVWVLVQVVLGPIGAAAYFLTIRPKLLAASGEPSAPPPPPGFAP